MKRIGYLLLQCLDILIYFGFTLLCENYRTIWKKVKTIKKNVPVKNKKHEAKSQDSESERLNKGNPMVQMLGLTKKFGQYAAVD